MRGLCQALSHIRRITHVIGETKDNINLTVAGMEDVPKKASENCCYSHLRARVLVSD